MLFLTNKQLFILLTQSANKLKASHEVGREHLTSLYDHLDWEDKDGCYNSSLFRSTTEFKSFTEVRNWKKWQNEKVSKVKVLTKFSKWEKMCPILGVECNRNVME